MEMVLGDVGIPLGLILAYAGEANDSDELEALKRKGWRLCNGDEVSRREYAALYRVIGDIWGRGDGVETFNLPDLRGAFVRGVDHGAGRDPEADDRTEIHPGGHTGDRVGTLQLASLEAHGHELSVAGSPKNNGLAIADVTAGGKNQMASHYRYGKGNTYVKPGDKDAYRAVDFGGSETRPANVSVNWIIYAGLPRS